MIPTTPTIPKTVLITGGSRGIGAACVRAFAAAGWHTAFTYHTSQQEAEQLSVSCHALALPWDACDPEAATVCVTQVQQQYGGLHTLVCNAGIAEQCLFQDITEQAWRQMFDINVMGAVRMIRAALPVFLRQNHAVDSCDNPADEMAQPATQPTAQQAAGVRVDTSACNIILVSSIWGQTGASCESHYAASKAALIGLGKSLAWELGPSGIRVNCVAPGVIATDMNAMHSPETMRTLADDTPLGRIGSPAEVAQSICYLASEQASFVTGQVLSVTGGFGMF